MAQHIGKRRAIMKTRWFPVALCLLAGLYHAAAATPAERARQLASQLTLDEKLALLHSRYTALPGKPAGAIGSAGYVPGVPRLGIPALQETDAGLGITNPLNARRGDTATALPSGMAMAATFDPDLAYRNGVLLGREAAAHGFNVLLGGGLNLAREPRGGRVFEYAGEDPLLAGTIVGATVSGTQSQHVISTVKHFAMNDQESARTAYSATIDPAALRESDLLAFEIAIERGHPGAVMCAYNKVNGVYACQNPDLLNRTLKGDWNYPGFVMSDWGAVHGADDMNTGLDQESGEQFDPVPFFANDLRQEVQQGRIKQARIDDAVQRILTSIITAGLLDHPPAPHIDTTADTETARQAEDAAIVLLRNQGNVLPLPKNLRSVAVFGGNADAGVPAGGGSSQVTPTGGIARAIPLGGVGQGAEFKTAVFDPPSPLARLRALLPQARIIFADGRYPEQAARLAASSDVAIVFATNWSGEDSDVPDLELPAGQNTLIARVAAANKRTVVVLETAGAVTMPWRDNVAAIVQAWYPGQGGADAITDVLFGDVNPSGHLPITFPASERDLANTLVANMDAPPGPAAPVIYPEGADAGYRWFARTGAKPLYPFGFGLSYTDFAMSHLQLTGGATLTIAFDVNNTGQRAGMAVPQAYLTSRGGTPMQRLLGWRKPMLQPGETAHISLTVDRRLLADFVPAADHWHVPAGVVSVGVGFDAEDINLHSDTRLTDQTLPP